MSTSPESQFSFQHFNQECDFGIEAANGEWVRKKKRPGRKPNPPTAEKRRAQNKASQRAYRQRKSERQEEEAKLRQEYVQENEELKRRLAQSEYEANYLRAIVLHLTLNNLTKQGSVPFAWAADDGETRLPTLMKIMLDNNYIAELEKAKQKAFHSDITTICKVTSACPLHDEEITIKNCHQDLQPGFFSQDTLQDASLSEPESSESENTTQNESESESVNQLTVHKKPIKNVLHQIPGLKTGDDFVNMSPLQALHIVRLQLKIGSIMGPTTWLALIPTPLQQIVPHDIRIDYLPAPPIRDRMILFQDYYDIDECFQYLTQSLVFIGGDMRILKNWTIDPGYSEKFWFLSHVFMDQSDHY